MSKSDTNKALQDDQEQDDDARDHPGPHECFRLAGRMISCKIITSVAARSQNPRSCETH
ncbi:MAG: hypothetical protein WBX11_09895 [Thiobacillaceae bacterium]